MSRLNSGKPKRSRRLSDSWGVIIGVAGLIIAVLALLIQVASFVLDNHLVR